MAQQFGHNAHYQTGGIGYKEWCEKYINSNYLTGDDTVEVYLCNGTKKEVPVHQAGVYFHSFKKLGTTISAEPLIHDNEVVYFDINELYALEFKDAKHPLFKDTKGAILPLGIPVKMESNVPFQQFGRFWRSMGANNINMSDDNIAISLFNAFSTTTYHMVSCKSEEKMKSIFNLLIKMVNILSAFNKGNKVVYGILKQLRNTISSQDMLQYSLSFIFGNKVMDKRIMLNMFDIVLKRTYKHNANLFKKTNPSDNHQIIGVIAVMFLAPLFKRYFAKEITESDMYSDYYSNFLEITEKIKELQPDSTSETDKDSELVCLISRLIGHYMDLDICKKLVDFSKNHKYAGQHAPFEDWGVLEKIIPSVEINFQNIYLDNKNPKKRVLLPEVVLSIEDNDTTKIVSSSTTEWSGVSLTQLGDFKIKPSVLGVSSSAKGNTMGKDFVANMRFTFGNTVLPVDREGYASSGMHFTDGKYEQKTAFSLENEFEISNTKESLIIYTQLYGKKHLIVKMNKSYTDEPIVIGFKNLSFRLVKTNTFSTTESVLAEKKDEKLAPAALL
jgi:hypothetical protein